MDPTLILFGIESAVKLGSKINDVLVDSTVERPLLLPLGPLYADVEEVEALDYFVQNPDLVAAGSARKPRGPYHGFSDAELVKAYRTLRSIDEQVAGRGGNLLTAKEIVKNVGRFEQYREGLGARPALQRIVGTVVEIGVDYFTANPEALGKDSNARRVTSSFLSALDDTDFAEGSRREIVGDLLGAALRTFDSERTLLVDDEKSRVLLGGVTKALIADIDALMADGASEAALADRESVFRRIGSSVLKGAATAFRDNSDLFLRRDGATKTLVQETVTNVLDGLGDQTDIFSNESLELIVRSALQATANQPDLLADNEFVQATIANSLAALAESEELFSEESFSAIVQASLEVVRDQAEMLVDPANPAEEVLSKAISAMAGSLAATVAQGSAPDLLSKGQLVELTKIVFQEVADNPEHLIGDAGTPMNTALAQVLGSVAAALGDQPGLLVSGEGLLSLVRGALRVAVVNADQLIDFDEDDSKTNLLFKVLRQVAEVVADESNDPRGIITRAIFVEIVERILPLVSANLEPLLAGQPDLVQEAVTTVLELAGDALRGRTNGANLPILIEEILRRALWDELKLSESSAVLSAAKLILRNVA